MTYRIAAYLRLSQADEDMEHTEKKESNSITNQRSLIKHYLHTKPEFTEGDHREYEYIEYVDDGISGTTTKHRPSFLRMIQDARSHHIDCIIVKDFSRFSREALVLGDYVEQIFPMIDIRFISINDHYDSTTSTMSGSASSLAISMKALVNEYYVKDISRKKAAAIHARLETGHSMGPVPFGYRRVDSNQYEIDPVSSQIIRKIYDLALEGQSFSSIARFLSQEGYPTPLQYGLEHPENRNGRRELKNLAPLWSFDSVRKILTDPVYAGTLTTYKSKYLPGKQKIRGTTTSEEQYSFPNAHPAIISLEEYEQVQRMLGRTPSTDTDLDTLPSGMQREIENVEAAPDSSIQTSSTSKATASQDDIWRPSRKFATQKLYAKDYPRHYILKGHLVCGYCNRKMILSKKGNYCNCPGSNARIESICPSNSYPTTPVEQELFRQIKIIAEGVIAAERAAQQEYRRNHKIIIDLKSRKVLLERELLQLSLQKQENYEGFVEQLITLVQYQMNSRSISCKAVTVTEELNSIIEEIQSLREYHVPIELQELAKKSILYSCSPEISEEMVDEFIHTATIRDQEPLQISWKHHDLLAKLGLI